MLCVEGAHKLLNEGAAVMSSETLQTTGGRVDGYEVRASDLLIHALRPLRFSFSLLCGLCYFAACTKTPSI